MIEYLQFMGLFLGGIILFVIGLLILLKEIKESKMDGKVADEYGFTPEKVADKIATHFNI